MSLLDQVLVGQVAPPFVVWQDSGDRRAGEIGIYQHQGQVEGGQLQGERIVFGAAAQDDGALGLSFAHGMGHLAFFDGGQQHADLLLAGFFFDRPDNGPVDRLWKGKEGELFHEQDEEPGV